MITELLYKWLQTLNCPECGKHVIMIYHEWNDSALFEYHHSDDPEKEVATPCIVTIPYEEGKIRYEQEWKLMYDK